MMKNGYKGGFEFSATLDYIYAFDATTELVDNWCYEDIYNTWMCDEALKKFLLDNNPWALRDISQRFLEIINRDMWSNPASNVLNNLKDIIINSESKIEKNEF